MAKEERENFESLHARAVALLTEYEKTEAALLNVLQEIDKTKTYRQMGFTSLFDYCVKCLGLTENVTLNFTTVRWVEIHHKKPVSLGGDNALENLITVCSAHHKIIHDGLRVEG